jgi:hypothetical protein
VVNGGQFGIINVAQFVTGAQFGILNVAEDVAGAPIGFVSIVKHGQHHLALWGSDTADLNLGVKLGNQHVYSLFTVGTERLTEDRRLFAGFGLGVHIPKRQVFFNIEALTLGIKEAGTWPDDLHMLHKGRMGMGWRLAPRFSVVGGATVNVYTSRLNDGADFAERMWYHGKENSTWVRVWPGLFFGFQI